MAGNVPAVKQPKIRFAKLICGVSFLLLTVGASAPGAARPPTVPSAAPPSSSEDIGADYEIVFGGVYLGVGSVEVTLGEDAAYRLELSARSDGWSSNLFDFSFVAESVGTLGETRPVPSLYAADSRGGDGKRRYVELSYPQDGTAPSVSVVPPFESEDAVPVPEGDRGGTQDPISLMLMPVRVDGAPCPRTLHGFDGRRRYDLVLTPMQTVEMALPGREAGPHSSQRRARVMKCSVRFTPVAGYEEAHKERISEGDYKTQVWLAPFQNADIYMPIRLQMNTGFGAAVIRATRLRDGTDEGRLAEN